MAIIADSSSIILKIDKSRVLISPISHASLVFLKPKVQNQSISLGKPNLLCLSNNRRSRTGHGNRRDFVVYSSTVEPVAPPPPSSGPPPNNFLGWIIRIMATIVLPFFSHKWMTLLKIKNEVETTVHVIEHIVDTVEEVAEEVEQAAEKIAHDLPEGGKLRNAVDFVENLAEKAAKDAHLAGDFIHKVEEAEKNVECLVESVADEAVSPKKADDER